MKPNFVMSNAILNNSSFNQGTSGMTLVDRYFYWGYYSETPKWYNYTTENIPGDTYIKRISGTYGVRTEYTFVLDINELEGMMVFAGINEHNRGRNQIGIWAVNSLSFELPSSDISDILNMDGTYTKGCNDIVCPHDGSSGSGSTISCVFLRITDGAIRSAISDAVIIPAGYQYFGFTDAYFGSIVDSVMSSTIAIFK
jgi:hypothetical protein